MQQKHSIILLIVVLVVVVLLFMSITASGKKLENTALNKSKNLLNKAGVNTGGANTNSNAGNSNANSTVTNFPLQQGSQGIAVQMVQALIGYTSSQITGVWDAGTTTQLTTMADNDDLFDDDETTVDQNDWNDQFGFVGANGYFPLGTGSTGAWVAVVQVLAGTTPDGNWGPNTAAAVASALQAANVPQKAQGQIQYAEFNSLMNYTLGLSVPATDTNGGTSDSTGSSWWSGFNKLITSF